MYYIKLKDTFLTSDAVDFLMSQKDGANYVVLYQILCLLTLKTNGKLAREVGEVIIPYDPDKIARDSKWFTKDTVVVALSFYKKLGLILRGEDGFDQIAGYEGIAGSETKWAEIKRQQRAKKEIGQCPKLVQDKSNTILESRDLENRTENEESKSESLNPSLSNQCLTNDRPTVCTVVPLIGFLFDHGYLNGFDLEDEDEKDRFRNLCFDLENKYGTKNVHISAKYFVATYCSRTYKNGMFAGWKLSTVREINSKYALFETAMRSNCEKFKDGFKGGDWDSFPLDAPSTEEEYEKALEKLGVDPKEMVSDADE